MAGPPAATGPVRIQALPGGATQKREEQGGCGLPILMHAAPMAGQLGGWCKEAWRDDRARCSLLDQTEQRRRWQGEGVGWGRWTQASPSRVIMGVVLV